MRTCVLSCMTFIAALAGGCGVGARRGTRPLRSEVIASPFVRRNPSGAGYRIPDVYIPGARSVYDATIAEKTISLPQTLDFRAFSGGGNVTIVRPSTLVTPGAQGSYGLNFP